MSHKNKVLLIVSKACIYIFKIYYLSEYTKAVAISPHLLLELTTSHSGQHGTIEHKHEVGLQLIQPKIVQPKNNAQIL